MNESDQIRLRHMLDAAREVTAFTQGKSRAALDEDRLLMRGLSMSIGIIGEAASKVSESVRNDHPQIPWRQIIGARNVLVHGYFQLDLDILWNTATQAVPTLITELEKLLSSQE